MRRVARPAAMSWLGEGERDGEPELKGHVEAGYARRARGELNTRQVVNRRGALPDQTEEPVQAVLVGRNLKDTAGRQAEAGEARDQGKKESLVVVVERAVQEDVSSL